jgi:hypothetical protein
MLASICISAGEDRPADQFGAAWIRIYTAPSMRMSKLKELLVTSYLLVIQKAIRRRQLMTQWCTQVNSIADDDDCVLIDVNFIFRQQVVYFLHDRFGYIYENAQSVIAFA